MLHAVVVGQVSWLNMCIYCVALKIQNVRKKICCEITAGNYNKTISINSENARINTASEKVGWSKLPSSLSIKLERFPEITHLPTLSLVTVFLPSIILSLLPSTTASPFRSILNQLLPVPAPIVAAVVLSPSSLGVGTTPA